MRETRQGEGKEKDDEIEKAGIHVDASWGKRCGKEMGEGEL